jgi:hypothetical protein
MDKPMGLLLSCSGDDCWSQEPSRLTSALRIERRCGHFGTPAAGGDSQRRQAKLLKKLKKGYGQADGPVAAAVQLQ